MLTLVRVPVGTPRLCDLTMVRRVLGQVDKRVDNRVLRRKRGHRQVHQLGNDGALLPQHAELHSVNERALLCCPRQPRALQLKRERNLRCVVWSFFALCS